MKKPVPITKSWYRSIVSETLIPVLLMIPIPNAIAVVMYIIIEKNSSFIEVLSHRGYQVIFDAWKTCGTGDAYTWLFALGFSIWGIASILLIPGETYFGPPTSTGYRPVYRDTGFRYFLLTVSLTSFILCSSDNIGVTLYRSLLPLTGTLILYGFIVTILLYLKGIVSPSPGENGSSENPIFDFYWGLELYPTIGRLFNVKLWTNSRFGMMLWQLIVLVCWKAQVELTGWNWAMAACSIIQTLYIGKFYYWERGYMQSIDIIVDHAGFYLCWGCIAFLPTILNQASLYFVENSPEISPILAVVYIVFGVTCTFLTYWADSQRLWARASDGKCSIWGKPARVIRAYYTDQKGKRQQSLLLASGFWGLSRHMNYVFEMFASISWALPGTPFTSILPYSYFLIITVLVFHHSHRDDRKCREKYGPYWEEYCKMVKYRVLPLVY